MTIAVVITTHGHAAKALLATAEMIIGEQDNVRCVDFVPGENGEVLAGKIRAAAAELDTSAGLLLLVDLWGGTPFNASSGIAHDDANTEVVTGVNVPMLVSVLMEREDITALPELTALAQREGADGVKSLKTQAAAKAAPAAAPSTATPAASQETFDENDPEVQRLRAEASAKASDGPHMSFGLWRIDDRLIHGQVATSWAKAVKCDAIFAISDEVANDPLRSKLLLQVAPAHLQSYVITVDKAIKVWHNPMYADRKVLWLVTKPGDIVRLIEGGVDIKQVNVGGMTHREGCKLISQAVAVDADDVAAFQRLNELGVKMTLQQLATSPAEDVMPKLASVKF